MNFSRPGIVAGELLDIRCSGYPWFFYLITIFTMTTGTMLLMWIGEQITERGIGNGMSLIITLGFCHQLPTALGMIFQQLNLDSQEPGQMNFSTVLVLARSICARGIRHDPCHSRTSAHPSAVCAKSGRVERKSKVEVPIFR